jgi:hypothetical protein
LTALRRSLAPHRGRRCDYDGQIDGLDCGARNLMADESLDVG